MCLAHHRAISLLSKSAQRTIFQLGTVSRCPFSNGCKLLVAAPTLSLSCGKPGSRGAAEKLRCFLWICWWGNWLCAWIAHIIGVWEEEGVTASQNTSA